MAVIACAECGYRVNIVRAAPNSAFPEHDLAEFERSNGLCREAPARRWLRPVEYTLARHIWRPHNLATERSPEFRYERDQRRSFWFSRRSEIGWRQSSADMNCPAMYGPNSGRRTSKTLDFVSMMLYTQNMVGAENGPEIGLSFSRN